MTEQTSFSLSALQPTKKYFFAMFFVSFVLLQIFILVIYQQSRASQDSGDQLIHSYEVLRLGRLSVIDAIDLANDEQLYLLTGSADYMQAFDATRAKLDAEMNSLSDYNLSNEEYQKNILNLRERIQALEKTGLSHIEAIRAKRIDAYLLKSYAMETHQAALAMRDAYDVLTKNESEIIATRRVRARTERSNYLWTLGVGTVVGLGILLICNAVIISLVARNNRAREKMRRDEKLFEIILDGLNDGIFDYNVATNTIAYSPSYQRMLGYSPDEMGEEQNSFYKYIHPDDLNESVDILEQFLNGEAPSYNNTFRVRRKDGEWMWILSRGVAIRNEKGEIERLLGTHTDITAQKQREQELAYFMKENERQRSELEQAMQKAEAASQAKSDFLATMSHEIRTPMNAVIGLSGLMLKTGLNAKQTQMMETLYANADILLRLVNDLLDISRIEASQVDLEARPFSFETIFKALHAMFDGQMASKGLRFSIDNQIGEQNFMGDVTRLQQIMVNLVNNALKFTLHGEIAVHAAMESRGDGLAQVMIAVQDTGVGIPPEKLENVFEKFVQADQTISRRFGGSGLGLAICRSLIELMKGEIAVVSTVGQGSTFTLNVPLKLASAPQALPPVIATVTDHEKASEGTVLVVEDYAPNVLVATLMLESLGYATDAASSGAEALNKLRAAAKPYAAILMDVQMQGMNGYETTQAVRGLERERGFRHLIIGLTAHALAGDREKCLAAGMDDYMSKPINPDVLAEKFRNRKQVA